MSRARRSSLVAVVALFGVCLGAVYQRASGLNPDSLWLDDEWVAVLASRASDEFLWTGSYPCPVGFVYLLRGATALFGVGTWQLQLVPFLASIVAVGLLGWVAARMGRCWILGLAAAALLAGGETFGLHSIRVKGFALDALVTTVLLFLAQAAHRRTTAGMVPLVLVAALVPLISFPGLLVGAVVVHLLGLGRCLGAFGVARTERRGGTLSLVALYDGVVLGLYLLTMRARGNEEIYRYWSTHYVPWSEPGELWAFFSTKGVDVFTQSLPGGLQWLAIAVPVGWLALLLEHRNRFLGSTIVAVYLALLVASALGFYPVGGWRTDVFTYPLAILSVVGAMQFVSVWRERRGSRVAVAGRPMIILVCTGILAFSGWRMLTKPFLYPQSSSAAAVAELTRTLREEDALLVHPWMNWAVGFYGPWAGRMVPAEGSTNAFFVIPDRPRTLVLSESVDGQEFAKNPAVVRAQLRPLIAQSPGRILFLGDRDLQEPLRWIRSELVVAGYHVARRRLFSKAVLLDFRR